MCPAEEGAYVRRFTPAAMTSVLKAASLILELKPRTEAWRSTS
jgi:hypothetical protein